MAKAIRKQVYDLTLADFNAAPVSLASYEVTAQLR
jgi:hypothetical protein